MALIVIDASVVIGFLDAADEHHEAAVAALDASGADDIVLPATAYAVRTRRDLQTGLRREVRLALGEIGPLKRLPAFLKSPVNRWLAPQRWYMRTRSLTRSFGPRYE